MRQLVPALLMLGLVGCAESHGPVADGSVPGDDGGGCAGFAPMCVQAWNHVCGDAFSSASCVDGSWQCPAGWSPGEASCWCYGSAPPGCTCTPSGWSCGALDAGAGAPCPSDPSAEGSACAMPGQECVYCPDRCGFCNILDCEAGVWTRIEAPGPCTHWQFPCGPTRCEGETQYCTHSTSDIAGEPDSYACVPFPGECRSCECLGGNECTGDASTGITVTWYGG